MSARTAGKLGRIRAALRQRVQDAVTRSAFIVQAGIKLQLSMSTSPSAPGTPPGVRTGLLRHSVQVDLSGLSLPNPSAKVGPNTPYAKIHEFGGTIRPKTAKALAVPIGAQGRAWAQAHGGTGSLGGHAGPGQLVLIKRQGRPPLLILPGKARGRGKSRGPGSFTPMFVLLSSVTLPPRPYVRPAVKVARPRVRAQFAPSILFAPA